MSKVFVTADPHFCHNKDFLFKPRGFASVDEMTEAIVENWNRIVGDEDRVYILGDLMLQDNEKGMETIRRLKGRLHVVIGNHDTENRRLLYESCYQIWEVKDIIRLKHKGYHFLMTHYPTLCSYPNPARPLRKTLVNLCGHSHTNDPFVDWDKGCIFHTELNTNGCTPWDLDTIIQLLEKKWR